MPSILHRNAWLTVVAFVARDACAWQDHTADMRPVSFSRDVAPILSSYCWQCHGPDASARQAGLRLDTRDAIESHVAERSVLIPGDGEASELVDRVSTDDPFDRMPPSNTGKRLNDDEIGLLRRWIDEGATYEEHWSFVPPHRPDLPSSASMPWVQNDIDAFVLQRLTVEGFSPSPRADAETLLRRMTLDLTGLPPTIEEIDAVLDHRSPDNALSEAVDRLLDSPRFGERMAVPWLDLARYADSYGYQSDQLSPTWPYRDWVVQAFNRNMPFDEFIHWQLAGDLLPDATREQRLATAFNRLHRMTNEGGSVEEEWRIEYVADRVQTFGTAFLGLTLQCARCHDHKFDPITTREYYGLTAYFNSIDEWGMYHDSSRVPTPSLLLPRDAEQEQLATLEQNVAEAAEAIERVEREQEPSFRDWLRERSERAQLTPGLVGHYPLDEIGAERRLANSVDESNPGSVAAANKLGEGVHEQAVQMTGDDPVSFPNVAGGLQPWNAFSVAFWVRIPEGLSECVIFHQSGGTDVGRFGAELALHDGALFFGVIRFWPGNAIAIQADDQLVTDTWTHVTVTYDGSGRADGLRLYVDGRSTRSTILRNTLTKSPGAGGTGITFGARFRDRGMTGGMIDDVHVFDRKIAPVEAEHLHDGVALITALEAADLDSLRAYYLAAHDGATRVAHKARSDAVRALLDVQTRLTEIMVMEDITPPRAAHVLARGAYDAPRSAATVVNRGTPAVLPPLPHDAPDNRLGLAQWTTANNNPLTARVVVNRFWQMFFGRGLVESSEDFGAQGTYPDAPALLDWLAIDFIESGWDVKHLCRQIVTSATYQQASALRDDLATRDPENRLFARGPSRRLTAEMMRDVALAASGLLDDAMGGPPVSPYQPPGLWREANSMSPAYRQSVGTALYRRSLYTVWKRTAPMPNMMALDAPAREVCTARRDTTQSPIQALVLLNDPQFVETARVMGERMLREGGETDAERCTFAFRLFTGRRPTKDERTLLVNLLRRQRELFDEDSDGAALLLSIGEHPADPTLAAGEVATAAVVAQAILNMDATVWKR